MAAAKKPHNPRTRITETQIKTIEKLAGEGLDLNTIALTTGMDRGTISLTNSKCKAAYLKGRAKLVKTMTAEVLKRSKGKNITETMLRSTADKIGVLDGTIEFKPPKTIDDVKAVMSKVLAAEAAGQISERKANKIMARLDKFVKMIDVHELRKEIDEIKEILDIKGLES